MFCYLSLLFPCFRKMDSDSTSLKSDISAI